MKTSQLVIAALALLLSPCSQQASAAGEARLEWVVGIPWGEGNVDGVGEAARFAGPLILAADPRGGLLLSDNYANTVRRADADFRVTTLAGQSGVRAFRDGEAHAARFAWPAGLAAGWDGSIYVAEQDNNVIRKIAPDGRVSLLAGSPGQSGNADGRGSRARFNSPTAVAVDAEHRLWVADRYNGLRIVSPSGYVTTWPAKSATSEAADGMPENTGDTNFPGIEFLAFAPDGSLVVAGEWGVSRIKGGQARRLLLLLSEDLREEIISAFSSVPEEQLTAEHAAQLLEAKRQGVRVSEISGLAVRADGAIFLSDKSQGLVFELMSDGTPKVIAGRATEERHNGAEGPATSALLNEPGSLAFDRQGRLFVANKSMSVQQILPDGEVRNVLGLANWYRKRDVDPASLPHGSADVAVENDKGEIFVVHRLNDEIHQFDANGRHLRQFGKDTGTIGAPASATHVDGEAEQSRFRYPQDIALGRAGELFVADGSGIRRIGPDGKVSSLVVGARTPQRQDGSFEEARFFNPYRLAFDGKRYLYVLDNSPYAGGGGAPEVVRQLDLETQQISTVVDLERIAEAYAQLPPEAQPMLGPELRDIACGPGGRLYILGKTGDLYTWTPDEGLKIAHLPDRLTPAGDDGAEEVILDAEGKKVENSLIRSATLSGWTEHLAVDTAGNAYMTDHLADLVLRLDPAGNLEIIAGTPGQRGNVAGPLPGSLEYPEGLSITPAGDLLITVMYSGVIRIRQPQQVRGQRIVPREPGPAQ